MLGEASWMLTVTSTAKVPWSSAIGAISTRPDPVPDTAVKTAWAPSGEAVAAVDCRSRPTSPARQAKSRATRREMRLYIAVLPPPGAGIVDIWELIASSFSRRVVEVRIPVGPVTVHGCCSVFGWRLGAFVRRDIGRGGRALWGASFRGRPDLGECNRPRPGVRGLGRGVAPNGWQVCGDLL